MIDIKGVPFNNGNVCIGSTCEELETRFKWNLSNKNSQVYKHKNKNPKIELIIAAPSSDKNSLKKVEYAYIEEYSQEYGKKPLNVRCNPIKLVKYNVKIEDEKKN